MKSVERAHTPNRLWQKIRLKRQYAAALGQIDDHLAHWPKFLVHKNKQRLTKITQYLIRMRKLQLKPAPTLVTMPARKEKMERRKEAKAETAAQLDRAIERELLARLQSGTYGDIYNFPQRQYERVLGTEELKEAEEEEEQEEEDEREKETIEEFVEGDDDDDDDDESEEEEEEEVEWLEDVDFAEEEDDMEDYLEGEESEEGDDDEEESEEEEPVPKGKKAAAAAVAAAKGKRRSGGAAPGSGPAAAAKRRRRGRMEIEYEEEREELRSKR
jgi:protein MAK16